ncbi:MAG TPA: ATP-dependent sacrificial sulfur transferase LarE [Candidatus Hydrogenedentes bacterium]|nr:ATP-dependent sacrificial sulfur transferase LarE [Candidatus Hydrogenedentota bacterium]
MSTAISPILAEKEKALKDIIASYGALAVAFSGGVDSTYLADVAAEVLGQNAHMLLADSPSVPREEFEEASAFAKTRGWRFTILHTREFDNEEYLKNEEKRCYHCKSELFRQMSLYARQYGITAIAHGEIADDALDATRFGVQAAKEYNAVAPLAQAGLHKEEIRLLSKERGLPTWNKASFACLASRFPRGRRIDLQEMLTIERAEQILKKKGFHQYRVRHHGDLCRIEIDPADFPKLLESNTRQEILAALQRLGYKHITLDLAGYRTGSTAL